MHLRGYSNLLVLALLFSISPWSALPEAQGARKEKKERSSSSYSASGKVQRGQASWYSVATNGGTHTASGQVLRDQAATAAHKTLPLGTKVRVTNLANGRSQVVTITDRGPYIAGRIIDVTIGTANRLGFVNRGVVPVKVETLGRTSLQSSSSRERSPRRANGSRRGRLFGRR